MIYRITVRLLTNVIVRKDHKDNKLPTVLIADDTDLPKSGLHMESIGMIFSHVRQKCILGYKAMMLCWSDGRTQFMLDFSLHGEKGKVQGLTSEQRKVWYNRVRDSPLIEVETALELYYLPYSLLPSGVLVSVEGWVALHFVLRNRP